ncbi:MAG: stalk domain-containing protein, partial [Lachnospiraceae bacterium]
ITLADANNATTTFTMPASAVSVKATYKDAPIVEDTPITAVNFTLNGYTLGEYAENATISAETTPENGITIPNNNYEYSFVLLDSEKSIVKGALEANTDYTLGIEFKVNDGFTFDGLAKDKVLLNGSIEASEIEPIVGESGYRAYFALPQLKADHTHVCTGEWKYNSSYHWKVCDDCGETVGKVAHEYTGRVCDICGYRKPSSSSSSSGGSTTYTITVEKTKDGSLTLSRKTASKGTTVTITPEPAEGFALDTLKVTDKNGDKVKLTEKDGKYTFTMPASKVTVTAAFEEVKQDISDTETEDRPVIVLAIGKTEAIVFGEVVVNDVAPVIRNERTMLPARFVAEALGAEVTWNPEMKKVVITKDERVLEIFIDQSFAFVDNKSVELDSPAFIENGRTYLPVRFISEGLDAEVQWNALTQQVYIFSN